MEKLPSYDGAGLVNLMAEIESSLGGTPGVKGLTEMLPEAPSYVLVLFDGLGMAQLEHPAAGVFRSTLSTSLTCGFPSTTTVSLSTVATGMTPAQHGTIGHLTYQPDLDTVVNTLKWVDMSGQPVRYDYASLLPRPNLWERLRGQGIEPITVQPGGFQATPLSRALYRGARFEGAWDTQDLVDATIELAREPGRFIFTYVPFVDVAGHSFGLGSSEFADAVKLAATIWEGILNGVPPGVAVVGTADHGLVEVKEDQKIRLTEYDSLRFAGDARVLQVWGESHASVANDVGGHLVDGLALLGPDPLSTAISKAPEAWIHAPTSHGLFPPAFDRRLFAYHGGLSSAEMEIPLLIG